MRDKGNAEPCEFRTDHRRSCSSSSEEASWSVDTSAQWSRLSAMDDLLTSQSSSSASSSDLPHPNRRKTRPHRVASSNLRGRSSAGRALDWQSRGSRVRVPSPPPEIAGQTVCRPGAVRDDRTVCHNFVTTYPSRLADSAAPVSSAMPGITCA